MDYPKVLIIDTDIELYEYSEGIWNSYGIKSHRVSDIEHALEEVSVCKYHLIIIVYRNEQLQFVLNSIQLFREMTLAPIVIASTNPIKPEHRISGFDKGADEVWEMPEQIEVAVAKGNAIIRRYLEIGKKIVRQSTVIISNSIILSTAQRLVFIKGIKVELARIEFDILTLLVTHPNRVYTYEQIFRNVWGEDYADNSKDILWRHISKLREMIQIDPSLPYFIKTNHGIGYSFNPQYDKH